MILLLCRVVDIPPYLLPTQNWTVSIICLEHNPPLTPKVHRQILSVSLCEELAMKLRQSQPLFVDCCVGLVADVGAKGENI